MGRHILSLLLITQHPSWVYIFQIYLRSIHPSLMPDFSLIHLSFYFIHTTSFEPPAPAILLIQLNLLSLLLIPRHILIRSNYSIYLIPSMDRQRRHLGRAFWGSIFCPYHNQNVSIYVAPAPFWCDYKTFIAGAKCDISQLDSPEPCPGWGLKDFWDTCRTARIKPHRITQLA